MFELHHLSKQFGKHTALHDLSLSIQEGERIALIGSSGSGKTTLLKLLNAQHLPTSGSLKLNGKDTSLFGAKELRLARSKIAYIPQDLGLVPSLRVFQNVLLGQIGRFSTLHLAKQFLFPSNREMEKIHSILDRVGIGEKIYHTTSSLSGGQQQRVAVARALYQEAHTLLADEPVSSVDPTRARDLVQLLNSIAEENNLTLVMSIHAIDLAKDYFPRIIALKQGSIFMDCASIDDQAIQELYQIEESSIIA